MKKFITLSALGMMLASILHAQDWTADLVRLNPDVIDSVKMISEGNRWFKTYMIHYHQPLQHDQPELGSLPLRALMSIYLEGSDIFTQMNQMHINGYNLDDNVINNPEQYIDFYMGTSQGELQCQYDGNLLQPEHRYFGKSCPDHPGATLGYCEAKEAAADFHALLEAMKKVFKGKWAVSGVSKGGVAAAVQHAYYPDDADCYVPYVAPFVFSQHDEHLVDYMMTQAWTPEMRKDILHIQKEMLQRSSVFDLYCTRVDLTADELNKERCKFLLRVCCLDHETHIRHKRSSVQAMLDINRAYLKAKGLDDYTDEMLVYMVSYLTFYLGNNGSDYERWSSNISTRALDFQFPVSSVFSIEDYQWKGRETANHYQQMLELGYYDLNFEYFYDTQQEVDSVTSLWHNTTKSLIQFNTGSLYDGVEFDPSLMNFVCQQTANANKPMLFIYGGDDLWTGGRMPEQYINNENVREYILSGLNHDACISDVRDKDLEAELWSFIDKIFKDNTNAIEQIEQRQGLKTRYNLMGQPTGDAHGFSIKNGHKILTE